MTSIVFTIVLIWLSKNIDKTNQERCEFKYKKHRNSYSVYSAPQTSEFRGEVEVSQVLGGKSLE